MAKDIIFLLGAGASVDAGMPLVTDLTKSLRERLPSARDVNGLLNPAFGQIFDFVQKFDQSVENNYERLLDWIKLILDVTKEPYKKLITVDIDPALVRAMADLAFEVAGREISALLNSREPNPDYLVRLGDFIPEKGRLKIFTLNYDCCLEDACYGAGIDITTGFEPLNHHWNPVLFEQQTNGINLYKLHGSLRWFGARNRNLPDDQFRRYLVPLELRPEDKLCEGWQKASSPMWVLGPEKVHSFDPFVTLLSEFQKCMRSANTLVIIGYGFGDIHINEIIDRSLDTGTRIIDVTLDSFHGNYWGERSYFHLPLSARNALINGEIKSILASQ